jgi:hypothetical protein
MSDVAIFATVFLAFFVLRLIAATVIFYWLLPRGDKCPNCDSVTLRVESPGWNRIAPWMRSSWCYACGWEGMLRHGPLSPAPQLSPSKRKGAAT